MLISSTYSQRCRWHGYGSVEEFELAVAHAILLVAQQSIALRKSFRIVLTGGNSPRKIYESLRNSHTDWASWNVYIGDDRCLPKDHTERNSRMAAQLWLNHVAIPPKQIHFIPAELGAEKATAGYQQTLAGIDRFDLVLLGLGDDGHTASLFPGNDWGIRGDSPSVIAVHNSPKPPSERVSLSANRLSAADKVFFLVIGDSKRQAVRNWRAGNGIPAAAITPANGVDVFTEATLLEA